MAADNLKQLGKRLGKTRKNIKFVSKNVSQNLPLVEQSVDLLGVLYTYRFEFKTYSNKTSVYLDVRIMQKFRELRRGIDG